MIVVGLDMYYPNTQNLGGKTPTFLVPKPDLNMSSTDTDLVREIKMKLTFGVVL